MQTPLKTKPENELTEEEIDCTYAVWGAFFDCLCHMLRMNVSMNAWNIIHFTADLTHKAKTVPQTLVTTGELYMRSHALETTLKWSYQGSQYVCQVILHPEYLLDSVRYVMYSNVSKWNSVMAHGKYRFEPRVEFVVTELEWMPIDQVLEFLPHHAMAKPIVNMLEKSGMVFEYHVKPAMTTIYPKINYDAF